MNFDEVIDGASKFKIKGFSFDEPDMKMLVIDEEDIDEHISKQPAAVAYYGALCKDARREYDDAKQAWKYQFSRYYSEASRELSKDKKKPTIAEIEAEAYRAHEQEVKDARKRLRELARQSDEAEMFFEAWKSKSFALGQLSNIMISGLLTRESVSGGDEHKQRVDRAVSAVRSSLSSQ